jgi:hypothetical protein
MTKIIINPHIDLQYAVYYILGLKEVFGKSNVRFARKSEMKQFVIQKKILNISFLVVENQQFTKVSIDHGDFNTILDMETYQWADIYGKVNTNWKLTSKENYPKIVCLATNFGVRGFNLFESVYYAFRNLPIVRPKNIKKYFAQYYKQRRKLWIKKYSLSKSEKGYIFSANTLWYSDDTNKLNETTNKIRAEFMEMCIKHPKIKFEGGFIPSMLGNESFKHLHMNKSYSQKEYIDKLSRSLFAFNTPAVWNCHGWKLGEFLCMGKAIVSTPLSNDLPEPLIHGENIFLIEDVSQLERVIYLMNNDTELRIRLEKNARIYFEKYVSPQASIRLLGLTKH